MHFWQGQIWAIGRNPKSLHGILSCITGRTRHPLIGWLYLFSCGIRIIPFGVVAKSVGDIPEPGLVEGVMTATRFSIHHIVGRSGVVSGVVQNLLGGWRKKRCSFLTGVYRNLIRSVFDALDVLELVSIILIFIFGISWQGFVHLVCVVVILSS